MAEQARGIGDEVRLLRARARCVVAVWPRGAELVGQELRNAAEAARIELRVGRGDGTRVSWNSKFVKLGPLWQSTQLPLPMKILSPRCAAAEIARECVRPARRSATNRSNGAGAVRMVAT